MIILKLLLILLYVFLVARNYNTFTKGRSIYILTVITFILSTYMLCGSNAANLDFDDAELDITGTRTLYEGLDVTNHAEYNVYFLYYRCMHLGQMLGLPYRTWWSIMSILAMTIIFIACKIHSFNYNFFLATFMAYYEMVFYSGFKFFYGFCFLLLAYGFLLRNTNKGRLLFALFILIGAGFHIMYFFFLILLIKPRKNPRNLVYVIVAITVFFTILMRLSGSAVYMLPLFYAIGNEHVSTYTESAVHLGFYIAIFVHAAVVYAVFKLRQYKISNEGKNTVVDTLFYTTLLSLLFCPFYAVALTFMRLITAFSLVVIVASSSVLNDSFKSRQLCTKLSLIIISSFWIMKLMTSSGAGRGFIEASLLPFFDVI